MMRYFKLILITLFLAPGNPAAAQLSFFEGTLQEAMAKARKEKKMLFIDFYADWCAPCKMMEKEVFTLPGIGDYFGQHFICCKIDADAPANKAAVERYQVTALPTMLFTDAGGKVLRTLNGALPGDELLHEARVATGDALSFEQLYDKIKKNKKDMAVRQEFLLQAPAFVSAQEGYERQKWSVRVESVFNDYLQGKTVENMANPDDFSLLVFFHPEKEKKDPVFDALVKHHDRFAEGVGKADVDKYLVGLFNNYLISLCREGKTEYKQELERIRTDLQGIYGEIPFGKLSAYEAVSLLSDAYYHLYRQNLSVFFEKMNAYFGGADSVLTANNYTMPVEDLFSFYQGNVPAGVYPQVIPWLEKALTFPRMSSPVKTKVLCLLGDCYKETQNAAKAKQCYNQAFFVSAEIEDKEMMKQLQTMIQNRLNSL